MCLRIRSRPSQPNTPDPAIDLWLGGHSHAMDPEQVYEGKGLIAKRRGVTFVHCSGLTRDHAGGPPADEPFADLS